MIIHILAITELDRKPVNLVFWSRTEQGLKDALIQNVGDFEAKYIINAIDLGQNDN